MYWTEQIATITNSDFNFAVSQAVVVKQRVVQAETAQCCIAGWEHVRVATCSVCLKSSAEQHARSFICIKAQPTAG